MSSQLLAQAGMVVAQVLLARRGITTKAEVPGAPAYTTTRRQYHRAVEDSVSGYLGSSGAVTRWRNDMGRALIESFTKGFERGIFDGGGDVVDIDPDDNSWLTNRINEELGFVTELFSVLRDSRDVITDTRAEARARADGYAATLDAVYAEGKMSGKKGQLLTWKFGDTEHCPTCARLDGQRHKAKWYLDRNYIPGKPGAAMDCHGFNCQCVLLTKGGDEFTI